MTGADNGTDKYAYDASGDLTADGNGNSYTYNADQMITASSGASYVYDALDERVEKTGGSNAGETIYFNGAPIALLDAGTYTDLIYANGQMIAEVAGTQTAVPVYRMEDHLGSLALQTDNSDNVTGTNTFLPFGQLLSTSTTDEFQFTELPQDTENSSYHAGYRNFSYQQGRWLSPDPTNGSYDITNPQSFNRYAYVNNNPMAFVDPSGLYDFTQWVGTAPWTGGWLSDAICTATQTIYVTDDGDGYGPVLSNCFGAWAMPWGGILPYISLLGFGGGGGGGGGAGPVTNAPNIATISAYHPSVGTCLGQAAISGGEDLLGLSMLPGSDPANWQWQSAGWNSGFRYTGAGEVMDSSVGLDAVENAADFVADNPAAQGTLRQFMRSQGVNWSMNHVANAAATLGKWAGRAGNVLAAYSAYERYQKCRGD